MLMVSSAGAKWRKRWRLTLVIRLWKPLQLEKNYLRTTWSVLPRLVKLLHTLHGANPTNEKYHFRNAWKYSALETSTFTEWIKDKCKKRIYWQLSFSCYMILIDTPPGSKLWEREGARETGPDRGQSKGKRAHGAEIPLRADQRDWPWEGTAQERGGRPEF